jgi:hypothetical protein
MANPNEPSSLPEAEASKPILFANVDYSKTQGDRFYANHIAAGATMFDVRLLFSDVDIDAAGKVLLARQTLTVMMSPELAGILQAALNQAMEAYTSTYGQTRTAEIIKTAAEKMKASHPPATE